METHLVYHVNKRLGIFSTGMPDYLDPIKVRKNGFDQRDALMTGKCGTDQLSPSRKAAAHVETVPRLEADPSHASNLLCAR